MSPSEDWSALIPFMLGFWALSFVVGYLLGSIPFGLILTRLAGLGDVREIGSGNIGATNVLRTGSKGLAALTLLCDALKGTLAVLFGAMFGPYAAILAGLGAFLGHLFPVWLKFQGGKGVATYIGVALGLMPLAALGFCVVWLIVAIISRYSSLAALSASAATVIGVTVAGQWAIAVLFGVMTVLLYVRHSANIRRLLKGEETRIGEPKKET